MNRFKVNFKRLKSRHIQIILIFGGLFITSLFFQNCSKGFELKDGELATLASLGAPTPTPMPMPVPTPTMPACNLPASLNFATHVKPILDRNCVACHSAQVALGGLDLTKITSSTITADQLPLFSKIIARIESTTSPMPPKPTAPLVNCEIATIKAWVGTPTAPPPVDQCLSSTAPADPGLIPAHRLNRLQYDNTIRDWLGVTQIPNSAGTMAAPSADLPGDPIGISGYTNDADSLQITPTEFRRYFEAATKIADQAIKVSRARVITCDLNVATCAEQILRNLATQGFRRPVEAAEITSLLKLYNQVRTETADATYGIQIALKSILISPNFLFLSPTEMLPVAAAGVSVNVGSHELASRLSYMIWATAPDASLMADANQGRLQDPAVLEAQVRRMLRDSRAENLVQSFGMQWLFQKGFTNPDATLYPQWNNQVRDSMTEETKRFLRYVILEDRSPYEFLTGRHTYLNQTLSTYYGFGNVQGTNFVQVPLTRERSGILTHGSVMNVTSLTRRTSVVMRGHFMLKHFLCNEPPPPPPNIPMLSEGEIMAGATPKDLVAGHLTNQTCVACHKIMDPIGLGFENFDVTGRFRTLYKPGIPVEANGVLPTGESFTSPAELGTIFANDAEFKSCFTKRLSSYVLSRTAFREVDKCSMKKMGAQAVAPSKGFSEVMVEIIKSEQFRKRKSEGI